MNTPPKLTRRTILAAPLVACAAPARAQGPAAFIAPGGQGAGASWGDAAPVTALSDLIARVGHGGEILVAADQGEYALDGEIAVSEGGVKGDKVAVRGVNSATGAPMAARVRGTRTDSAMGDACFRLRRGASHLRFSHFDFRDVGNGCFNVSAPLSGLIVEDCTFENVYRFFENTAGSEHGHASLRDFVIRRCRGVRAERGFLRIRYNSRNGLIEDCAAQGLANEAGLIPAGCAIHDRASAITYRRCVMENFQQWRPPGFYWNGDGFSDEPDNRDIRYEQCEARGSTDGGFDCKSPGVVLEGCVAEDNKRNFRLWGERATLIDCTSRNPNFRGREVEHANACHVWLGNEGRGRVVLVNLTVADHDATPIVEFDQETGRAEFQGVTIDSPRVNWGTAEDRIRASMLRQR